MRAEQFLLAFNDVINSGVAVEIPKGSNRGPWVDAALKLAGSSPGNPWCASGIYKIAIDTNLYKKSELPSHPASVYGWRTFFLALKRVFTDITQVKRGDLGLWLDANNKGHIFAIVELRKIGPLYYIRTEEGNASNENGGREGWLATKKLRLVTSKYQFIRFSDY